MSDATPASAAALAEGENCAQAGWLLAVRSSRLAAGSIEADYLVHVCVRALLEMLDPSTDEIDVEALHRAVAIFEERA